MSDIRIKDIGKDISLTPIEIVMRDETPDNIFQIITSTILSIYTQLEVHIGFSYKKRRLSCVLL